MRDALRSFFLVNQHESRASTTTCDGLFLRLTLAIRTTNSPSRRGSRAALMPALSHIIMHAEYMTTWAESRQQKQASGILMETVLIRRVSNKNLSNWATLSCVYSVCELSVTTECFHYQTKTQQQIQSGCCWRENVHHFSSAALHFSKY